MKILKFGGTSMGSSVMINEVANIVLNSNKIEEVMVVVSAMSGITDKLIELTKSAQKKDFNKVKKIFSNIKNHHKNTLKEIVGNDNFEIKWNENFKNVFQQLELIAEGTSLIGEVSDKIKASILYFGEIFSSLLLIETLKLKGVDAFQILSKQYIKTDENYLDGIVDFIKTKNLIKKKIQLIKNSIPVITGFAGSDSKNNTTLLSRGGSDYVATIFGFALGVSGVEIWTDVAGIFSSDPRIIKNPICFDKLDYRICAELALAGAKVLHPKTISPVIKQGIPIFVKSTMEPNKAGTKICNHKSEGIKGINLCNENILFHFTDNTMFGEIGYINNITKKFGDYGIPIDSVATSEVSFTCSIKKKDFSKKIIKNFKGVGNFEVIENLSKISIVGEKIGFNCCLLKDVFNTLNGYKIYLISKGASFNNITLFVEEKYSKEILKLLHDKLFYNK